jgi:predicted nuclease of restriction endonuclease-like (RecB) superfamily
LTDPLSLVSEPYSRLLNSVKQRIQTAQISATLAVNRELMLLYWHIGKEILERQQSEGWGTKVIDRLAKDLKRELTDRSGFSSRNLKYMRAFAEAYPDETIVQRSVAQLPWRHNIALLEKLQSLEHRLWYAQQTLDQGWSRDILAM